MRQQCSWLVVCGLMAVWQQFRQSLVTVCTGKSIRHTQFSAMRGRGGRAGSGRDSRRRKCGGV